MKLYLSSQKFGNNPKFLKEWIQHHDKRILLIFNALDAKSEDKIKNNIKDDIYLLEQIGFLVKVVDLKKYFNKKEQLKKDFKQYNTFCVMGGNVFILRQAMNYSGFDIFLKEISNDNNYLYIGYSAGSCVLSKKIDIFKNIDEPINYYSKEKIIYDGINLIDYVFIPHYKSNYHKGYLIDELVEKCKKENIDYKTFSDGEVIIENLISENLNSINNLLASKKIAIFGYPASGKSTLGNFLSQKLKIELYSLDEIRYKYSINGIKDDNKFLNEYNNILKKEKWIIEGNALDWIDSRLEQADILIFFDSTVEKCIENYKNREDKIKTGEEKRLNFDTSKTSNDIIEWIKNRYRKKIEKLKPDLNKYKNKLIVINSYSELDDIKNKI